MKKSNAKQQETKKADVTGAIPTVKDAENINYQSIAASLCKKKLTPEQKEDIKKFHKQYDKVHDLKNKK